MAGLVGDIALKKQSADGGAPSLLALENRRRRRPPVSGRLRRETRGSNPLSSTTQSRQTDPVSRATKTLAKERVIMAIVGFFI
jgi:hypothetical protein